MSKFWTNERAGRCQRLWGEGWSASQIGADIGCTRNSVLSKIHRSGWAKSGAPMPRPPQKPRARRANSQTTNPRAAAARALAAVLAGPEPAREAAFTARSGGGKALLDLEPGECRWPLGEPGEADFGFCAGQQYEGRPYCLGHARMAYQPAGRRQ